MKTCKIENICLTTSGEFILFQNYESIVPSMRKILSEKPWVYTQGRIDSDRGLFSVRVEDGDLAMELDREGQVESVRVSKENTFEEYELHSKFSIIEEPVYALHRYGVGNVTSNFVENLNMVVTLMMSYFTGSTTNTLEKLLNNHILFLDDVFEMDGEEWKASYKHPPEVCEKISTESASLLSINPILQLCNRGDIYSIEKTPCRNNHRTSKKNRVGSKPIIQTCFSQFYAGMSVELTKFFGREMIFNQMRNLAYSKLGIVPQSKGKTLLVAIHKSTSPYDQSIANADQLVDYFTSKIQQGAKLRIELVDLKSRSVPELIHFFSDVDVFISDQESASMGIFMRDDTSLIVAPSCSASENKCHRGMILLDTFPNINVFNVHDFVPDVSCQARELKTNRDNCDPLLDPEAIFKVLMPALLSIL